MPSVQLDARRLLEFTELGLRKIEKCPVVAVESVAGESRERITQECFAFGGHTPVAVEFRAEACAVLLCCRQFLLSAAERYFSREQIRVPPAKARSSENGDHGCRHEPD